LDHYEKPSHFAHINIFCQADQSHFFYDNEMFLEDIDALCSTSYSSISAPHIQDGFTQLGRTIYPYMAGIMGDVIQERMKKTFKAYYGYDIPSDSYFSPGGCFAVTKEQLFSQSFEVYRQYAIKKAPKIYGFRDRLENTLIKKHNYSLDIQV
jgi:hypothetical protein